MGLAAVMQQPQGRGRGHVVWQLEASWDILEPKALKDIEVTKVDAEWMSVGSAWSMMALLLLLLKDAQLLQPCPWFSLAACWATNASKLLSPS